MNKLAMQTCSAGISQRHTAVGLHVGNLRRIGGVWKFKAIGYDAFSQVIPGGGPLTEKHNTTFAALDDELVNIALCPNHRI